MQNKIERNTFEKILQYDRAVLEAAIIQDVLQFKLTVTESVDVTHTYIGQITNLDEHEKLKQNFNNIEEVYEDLIESKNVHLSLSELSVTFMGKLGKKMIQLAKIVLRQVALGGGGERGDVVNDQEENDQFAQLEEIIDRCNGKNDLDNDEIKKHFEILANSMIELKQLKFEFKHKKLHQQVVNINQQISSFRKSRENIFQTTTNEINLLRKELQAVNEKTEMLPISFKQFQSTIGEKVSHIESSVTQELSKLKQSSSKMIQLQQSIQKKDSNNSQQEKPSSLSASRQKYQKWQNLFSFNGSILQKIKGNSQHQFIFFQQIKSDQEFVFKIKIIKSQRRLINIGIVDYQPQKQQEFSSGTDNAITYYARNGKKYPTRQIQGSGVIAGETVQVRVDRKNNIIRWIVNDQQRASLVHKMLGDSTRKFMPYVDIENVGDKIEWSL